METRQLLIENAQYITGWMTVGELSFLAETASKLKDNSVIFEIGSLCGRSARAIADNAPESSRIFCIDPWDFLIPTIDNVSIPVNELIHQQFLGNLQDHIRADKVIPIHMKWDDFNPPIKADFIFIGGDHKYEAIRHDILKSLKYIKPGGIIAGHDFNFDPVFKAVHEIFPSNDINVEETIWWIQKS